jgi:hypothetical protein
MRRLLTARATVGAIVCAALVCGCGAILGDFSNGTPDGGGEDSGMPGEGDSGMIMTGDGQVQVDGSTDATADTAVPPGEDSGGYDAPIDTYQPPIDAGPPGNPGTALTAGGVNAKSAHYAVFAALGESPGGNLTSSSANYKLQSGVIGATQ